MGANSMKTYKKKSPQIQAIQFVDNPETIKQILKILQRYNFYPKYEVFQINNFSPSGKRIRWYDQNKDSHKSLYLNDYLVKTKTNTLEIWGKIAFESMWE
jgi:hypothetical protein